MQLRVFLLSLLCFFFSIYLALAKSKKNLNQNLMEAELEEQSEENMEEASKVKSNKAHSQTGRPGRGESF